jgi:hypothetical protein
VVNCGDLVSKIVGYLGRKTKWSLRSLNKDFRDLIIPRTMISMRFFGDKILETSFFSSALHDCKKVERLEIREAIISNTAVSALEAITNEQTSQIL